MKKILLLALFSIISIFSFSQQGKIDSLKLVLQKTQIDTIRLNAYFELTSLFGGRNVDTAEIYLDSLIHLAIIKNLKKYELTGYSQKGVLSFRRGNPKKAIDIWKQALKDKEIDEYPIQKGNYYNNIAVGYKTFKEKDSVVKFLTKSIELNERLKNNLGLIANYFAISDFYFSTNDNDLSLKYLQKLQKLAVETNDKLAIARTNILLGSISRREYDFVDAVKHFENALSYFMEYEPTNLIMKRGLKYEIIKTKIRQKKYEESIAEILELKEEFEKILSEESFWNEVNTSLLICYNRTSNFEKANPIYNLLSKIEPDERKEPELIRIIAISQYEVLSKKISNNTKKRLEQAEQLAKQLTNGERYLYTTELFGLLELNLKNHQSALHYFTKAEKIRDSVDFEKNKIINLSQKRKFNEAVKENENLALKQQNAQQALLTEREKTQKWAAGGGLAVSLAALGIFFIAFKKNQKQKKEIERQKNMVEHLQRELHHRLKNNLAFIDFFITLAKGKFPDPAYRQKLDELQNRIGSMFEVHKQLFKKEDVTSVNAKTYISALVENVKNAFDNPNITLREEVEDTNLKADTSFPIGLIVNEFVTNSYKYAFPNNEKGTISIKLDEDLDEYHLQLNDNGKGLPPEFNIDGLQSFGMETIKLLTQEYKGTFKLDGTHGVKMDITFPKNAA